MQKLYKGIRSLKQWPNRGRPGSEANTRELLFLTLPYLAVYRLREEAIEILHIYHPAQDWHTT